MQLEQTSLYWMLINYVTLQNGVTATTHVLTIFNGVNLVYKHASVTIYVYKT